MTTVQQFIENLADTDEKKLFAEGILTNRGLGRVKNAEISQVFTKQEAIEAFEKFFNTQDFKELAYQNSFAVPLHKNEKITAIKLGAQEILEMIMNQK